MNNYVIGFIMAVLGGFLMGFSIRGYIAIDEMEQMSIIPQTYLSYIKYDSGVLHTTWEGTNTDYKIALSFERDEVIKMCKAIED